jgi:hypothetical protein
VDCTTLTHSPKAGLFSASRTAFITESYNALNRDSGGHGESAALPLPLLQIAAVTVRLPLPHDCHTAAASHFQHCDTFSTN